MRSALHYAWSPISEWRSKRECKRSRPILVDIQTELQLQYRALFIVVYRLKEIVR
jgi:hypothetical protein